MIGFPLFPDVASTIATSVDRLYFFLTGVTAFFTVSIFLFILYFAVRYRRRANRVAEQLNPDAEHKSIGLEIAWSVIPFMITLVMFTWGSSLYMANSLVPDQPVDIYVVGRQWMWKNQHTKRRREINELHVPLCQPVKLTMASQDVIHSFFIPASRGKQDVVPGRYVTIWFQPTRAGEYHLVCAEYCGTYHSG